MSTPIGKEQFRAARALTGQSQAQICALADIPLITLRRIEGRPDHTGLVATDTLNKIRTVYEELGVQFLTEGATSIGLGVAMRLGK